MIRYQLLGVLLSSALTSCASSSKVQSSGAPEQVVEQLDLLKRASFELGCPAEQLKAQDLGQGTTAGVTGCGKQAVYKHMGAGRGWFANTATVEAK